MFSNSQDKDEHLVTRGRQRPVIIVIVMAPIIFGVAAFMVIKNCNLFTIGPFAPDETENQTQVSPLTSPQPTFVDSYSLQTELPPTPTLSPDARVSMPTPTLIPVVGPWPTLSPLPPHLRGLITHGDRAEPKIALTFDVGEREGNPAGYDAEIVRVLNETETPATFFLGGLWMIHNVEPTKELATNSLFELGNHAWSHLDFSQISPEQMTTEILLTQQTMWELLGWQTELFRLPYGTYTEEALDVIADHGMYTIQWDVVSGDPDPNITADRMIPWVVDQVQPGSIIIMHANGRGWHTAEALPVIIETLRDQGYTFTTLSDLLGLRKSQPPNHN